MDAGTVYSDRLGAIRDEQFAAVAARLDLGRFISAAPTTSGLFGQNVFLTTSKGEFVLRGAPHWVKEIDETEHHREDRWQFTKETWFARQLHERTTAPVPWPFLHEQSDDILGWPFIVMPRAPGECFDERSIMKALSPEDRRTVARALGENLAQMQELTSPFAGDFSPKTIELAPYPDGYVSWVVREIGTMTKQVSDNVTDDDLAWIAAASERALGVKQQPANTFVHGDYKLNNLTVLREGDIWRVGGVFDLHEARFGDGALDLVRQACSYLDTEPALARAFVEAYDARHDRDPARRERMPLYVINDRMKFWAFFNRPGKRAAWAEGKTFRGWTTRYMDGLLSLL